MSLTFDDGTFIRAQMETPLPPPVRNLGPLGWMRENLFSSVLNTILTLIGIALALLIFPPLIRFLFIDAVWTGENREACLGPDVGACWPFIHAKFGQLIYGFYPSAERWRPNLVFALGAILLVPLLIPSAPMKRLNSLLFFVIYPIIAYVLMIWVLKVPLEIARYGILLSAMPPGVNIYVFASYYNRGVNVAANTILIATIASAVTVSVWLYILGG